MVARASAAAQRSVALGSMHSTGTDWYSLVVVPFLRVAAPSRQKQQQLQWGLILFSTLRFPPSHPTHASPSRRQSSGVISRLRGVGNFRQPTMTRPKVPDDKRIRTAQACESCKRRKQKCNGLKPCNTCTKRNFVCEYQAPNGHTVAASSPTDSADEPAPKRPKSSGRGYHPNELPSTLLGLPTPIPPPSILAQPAREPEPEPECHSRQSTVSANDEVADVYTETRMLQDPTGRLLYLGDSATLSYLQFIRMIVESVDGPSQFTTDPSRHRLMEATTTLPPDMRPPVLLPDRKTAHVLVKAYFTNASPPLCLSP